jgi:hypothetical protein
MVVVAVVQVDSQMVLMKMVDQVDLVVVVRNLLMVVLPEVVEMPIQILIPQDRDTLVAMVRLTQPQRDQVAAQELLVARGVPVVSV